MYQRILVPIDGSPTARKGLAEAIALARMSGGRIRLLHVVDELSFVLGAGPAGAAYSGDVIGMLRDAGRAVLAAAEAEVRAAGVPVDTEMHDGFEGRVCDIVAAAATEWKAEVLVIGTHGRRGVGRMLLGSDAEQIVRLSPAPVLLVRGDTPGPR
jgi:nucleotide-binding universal stress UspA family protein